MIRARSPIRSPIPLLLLALLALPPLASARVGAYPGRGIAFSLSPSRYNRVEGFFAGAEVYVAPSRWRGAGILGSAGYGVANREWRHEIGLRVRRGNLNLALNQYDRTASLDDSLIATAANTFTSLMAKRDYKDYFRASEGLEILASHRYRAHFLLQARVAFSNLRNMPVATNWSVFRRDEAFRANPRVAEGKEGLISAGAALDRTAPNPLSRSGTFLRGTYERRFRDFQGDGLQLEFRRYQVMPFGRQTLVLRGLASSRARFAPDDSLHLLYLGGLRTLRGYTFREFHGNRLLMVNADYFFRNLTRMVDLVFFFDSGWTATRSPSASLFSGFGDVMWNDFRSDAGIALSFMGDALHMDLARRLDRRHAGWVFTVYGGRKF